MIRVMIRVGLITLKEAAERLGVSLITARRMVKDGRLKAELQDGPRGPCYFVDEAEIQTAQAITEVVPVTRQVAIPELVNAIAAKVTEALTEELARTRTVIEDIAETEARTRAELEALRQELAATREAQERIEWSIEDRDRKLVKALRSLTEKRRPWWVRILKRGDKRHEEG